MKTNEKRIYDYRAFEGADVSVSISLFEYGLIWKKIKDYYKFVYGVKTDKNGIYTRFDETCLDTDINILDADINIKEEFDWANWDDLFKFLGTSEEEFIKQKLPRQISDLISYYGYEEILGRNCEGFEISGYE